MNNSPLLTDLYQLTMLQAYHAERMQQTAVFELFVRRLPRERNFLVAAGLEQALEFLENLRFSDDELAWLETTGFFRPAFLERLARLRFTGEVHAMPEGTIFFADEPILRVRAPILEAQLVESRLINILHLQSLIASKAARCVLAGRGKALVDFGMRRAHGAEAAVFGARASYLTGFAGTATVLAGRRYGIPLFGTMAHSYIETHAREDEAFERFAETQPGNVTLLIDTYDTEAAAATVVRLAPKLAARGVPVNAVRLDSGDLGAHARRVRAILDGGGLPHVRILASGNIDEHRIARLVAEDAPIDAFGIGAHLDTSADVPYLDAVYKLQEYAGTPRRKRSEGKATWPGRKQVYRRYRADGVMAGDVLTVEGDAEEGEPLLVPVLAQGRRLRRDMLGESRERFQAQLARLPAALRVLEPAPAYAVTVAPRLHALAAEVDRRLAGS